MSVRDIHLSATDTSTLLAGLFPYQSGKTINLRQLFLSSNVRKRKSMVAFLSGRGIPNERKSVMDAIRSALQPAAEGLMTMRGTDVRFLSLGFLSCKVDQQQSQVLPELVCASRHLRSESAIAVGCTAALISAFAVMATVPNHARFIMHDESFLKALRCAEQSLTYWRVGSVDATGSLQAEKRALERAILGARGVAEFAVQTSMNPGDALRLQLSVALACAFPKHALVDEHQQSLLLNFIMARNLAVTAGDTASPILPEPESVASAVAALGNVVPLSALPASALSRLCEQARSTASNDDSATSHSASSSWQTVSAASSRASIDSLTGVLEVFSEL